jgi:hypothetical protein
VRCAEQGGHAVGVGLSAQHNEFGVVGPVVVIAVQKAQRLVMRTVRDAWLR